MANRSSSKAKTGKNKSKLGKKPVKVFMQGEPLSPWRENIHEIIFEADTPAG